MSAPLSCARAPLPGQVIYPEGDTLCDFYILLSGRVAISVEGRKLALLVDRSHFGELEVKLFSTIWWMR